LYIFQFPAISIARILSGYADGTLGGERKTVLIAMAANAAIAVAKGVAGALSGSAGLLAEAAHSVADTINQVFLLVSLSLGEKPPDEEHPFGHGKERFFWALLAAVMIFVAGSIFSVVEGVLRLRQKGGEQSYALVYGVLVFALVAESLALARAVRQTRRAAGEAGLPFARFVRESREPTNKTVVAEDAVAVTGVLVALTGTALHQLTGNVVWDAAAAWVIGFLLALVAFGLGWNMKDLLIGAAARPEQRQRLREVIESHPSVDALVDLRTMYIGPHDLLVAARVDLRDGLDSSDVERTADELDSTLREAVSEVEQVFLDATPRGSH
jgi:cation diffusion facilitator family transporter